ncbi:MAG: serine/threonine-protein kinase [Acidobacteriota bacterium]
MSTFSEASIPAQIGRFRIVEKIGEGAMGTVYKAMDTLIHRPVAIKTIRLDVEKSSEKYQEVCQRFYHEARASAILAHPNIVTLYDLGDHEGVPFLAMELIDGKTLATYMSADTTLDKRQVCEILAQVGSALDFAHEKGIIHRDIKPGNIMIDKTGKVKVMDFGIAKMMDSTSTRTGTFVGTPSYISPEQASEGKVDHRCDLFSLAVMAFELLTNEKPFQGSTIPNLLYKIVFENPIRPRGLDRLGTTLQDWDKVFLRALAKDPEKRFQRAAEFVAAIRLHILHETQSFTPLVTSTGDSISPTALLQVPTRTQLLSTSQAPPPREVTARLPESTSYPLQGTGRAPALPGASVAPPAADADRVAITSRSKVISLALLLVLAGVLGFLIIRMYNPDWGWPAGGAPIAVSLRIESEPPGAQVLLDGTPANATTPATLPLTSTDEVVKTVTLRKPCYKDYSSPVRLQRNHEPPPIAAVLEPVPVQIEVRTTPAGARLSLDGDKRKVLQSPATISLDCGTTHKLSIEHAGFKSFVQDIDPASVVSPLIVELEPVGAPGSIEIMATYEYRIYSGSSMLKEASNRSSLQLAPGNYRLRFTNKAILLNLTIPVQVSSNRTQTIELPRVGTLKGVSTMPENCEVCLDGTLCDYAPIGTLYLVEGRHTVTGKWPDGRTKTIEITIQAGGVIDRIFLQP